MVYTLKAELMFRVRKCHIYFEAGHFELCLEIPVVCSGREILDKAVLD
jgi:hypothetical protein